jgi:hypothetical protein
VALVLTGVLSLRTGVVVALVLEALPAVVLVVEAAAFRRAYRTTRQGGGRRAALAAGAEAVCPPVFLRLGRAEAGVVRSLWWAVRRRSAVGPDEVRLAYAGRFRLVLEALTVLGALETVVAHVLLPWETVRWALLAVSPYASVWVLGSALSLFQHPHLLRDDELVLRFGHREPDLPDALHVNGEPMNLAHVVGVLLGNRDLERRLAAENTGRLTTAA